jgi:putative RNA 2'-phosphotransferase
MNDLIKISKFLSLVLRHKPDAIRIKLDGAGWVDVDTLLEALKIYGKAIDKATLDEVVATNNKKRFEYSPDGSKIRACQGHSVKDVDLGLEPKAPPDILYHGTADRFVNSIINEGINPGSRQYVHLSLDTETAVKVGQRHGKPIVLKVISKEMHQDGHAFFLSHNNVWLTKFVPPEYVSVSA